MITPAVLHERIKNNSHYALPQVIVFNKNLFSRNLCPSCIK